MMGLSCMCECCAFAVRVCVGGGRRCLRVQTCVDSAVQLLAAGGSLGGVGGAAAAPAVRSTLSRMPRLRCPPVPFLACFVICACLRCCWLYWLVLARVRFLECVARPLAPLCWCLPSLRPTSGKPRSLRLGPPWERGNGKPILRTLTRCCSPLYVPAGCKEGRAHVFVLGCVCFRVSL